ncbi:hypothetical protein OAN94_01910 [Verrucomicrobiales bacterium]|nr:hypothetical protein [Verrucomicrobiales bacterium]MDC0503005.1 hypothetical protein [Verrucomicrobiales bacterium]MDF1786582.1 hypothetical protein [Verrucomicrobiales bacterium]
MLAIELAFQGSITITGNKFSNSYMGGGQHKRKIKRDHKEQIVVGNGVPLQKTDDIVINGNSVGGMAGKSVTCDRECRGILIIGNLVSDFGRGKKVDGAIDSPLDEHSIVKDNSIRRIERL